MINLSQKQCKFYYGYYVKTEFYPLLKLLINRGGLFLIALLLVLFLSAFYNSGDVNYALDKVYEGILPTIKWLIILFFVVVYAQRVYSKWLFLKKKKEDRLQIDYHCPGAINKEWIKWNKE